MLDFDEELAKFSPIAQAVDVENMIEKEALVDMTDIMKEMLEKAQQEKEQQ